MVSAAVGSRRQIDRGVAHAGGDQELQLGELIEHRARKRRALAHCQDDFEILQRADGGLRRGKWLVEDGDVDAILDLGPVREFQRDIEIVIENCTA
jgi:hypothetical protein